MAKALFWTLFVVAISCFDALRDVGRGQFEYWVWHTFKWLSFYPPLAYIFYRNVYRPVKSIWYWRWIIPMLCVFLSAWGWLLMAKWFRPEHWGPWSSQWFGFLF